MAATAGPAGRVVLVGAHGHGRWHLQNLRRLAEAGIARLVGVCDLRPLDGPLRALAGDVPVRADLGRLVAETGAGITIVCTPIHTHVDLTLAAMRAGCHVLLEKPPAPSLAEYRRLVAGAEAAGLACQVGFQSLGSAAVPRVRALIEAGAVGEVRGIGGACAWIRDASYYGRAAWAGRRHLDGAPVVDGALTNPFAHAAATALALAGATGPGSLHSVEVELHRANPIEADDTSCLRMRTTGGLVVTIAATLAAQRPRQPVLVVHGTAGSITLTYKTGEVRLRTAGRDETIVHPDTDLLENLLAHVRDRGAAGDPPRPGVPLLVPLAATHSFMEVVETVRLAPDPVEIPPEYRRLEGEGDAARRTVPGVDALVDRVAETLQTFSELGAPWSRPGYLRRYATAAF